MKSKFRLFFPCYFSFFVNGAMVLLVGAILPYIIEEAGINYSVAGGFLSAFAIGNLIASFVNPPMASKIGRKATIIIFSALIPVMLFVITLLPPVPVIYAAFVLVGIGRGSVSIINNAVVNDNSNGKPTALNLLHMTFAAGAFLAPFITSLYIGNGFGWRAPAYTIIAGSALSVMIASVICFLPIVILLLANKDLDGKTKKIVTVVAAIALVLASLFSIDFNPVSAEELAEAQQTVGNGSVYWTQFGKSYHLDPNCHTLMRSSKVYQGTIEEAFEANRTDPCDFCALEQE